MSIGAGVRRCLGPLLAVSSVVAQSGDPAFDPPAASIRSAASLEVASRSVGAPAPVAGLGRFATVVAGVRPGRLSPGERGVVRLVVEPRLGLGHDDLVLVDVTLVDVTPTSGSAGVSRAGGIATRPAGVAWIVDVPILVDPAAAPGQSAVDLIVVADVAGHGRRTTSTTATFRVGRVAEPRRDSRRGRPGAGHPAGRSAVPERVPARHLDAMDELADEGSRDLAPAPDPAADALAPGPGRHLLHGGVLLAAITLTFGLWRLLRGRSAVHRG